MKKRLGSIFILSYVLVILVALPLVSGCSSTASPSSTPAATSAAPAASATKTGTPVAANAPVVRIGIMGGQTGPAAASVIQQLKELENIFKYINEVEGGVNGIKLEWRTIDNKGTPDGALLAYKELRDSFKPQLYYAVEDYYLLGAKKMIDDDQAVIFTSGTLDPRCFVPADRFFSIAIPTVDGLGGYVKWVKQNYTGTGNPKIGLLNWDLPSGMGYKQGEAWMTRQGVELVPMQYSMANLDLKAQFMKFKDVGVNAIWMLTTSQIAAQAVNDMNALGLKDKIPLTFNEYVESDVLLRLAGKTAEGFTIVRSESPYSDNSQGAQLYSRIWKWADNKDVWSDNRLMISLKAAITAAINQAATDVGKDKVDNVAIYNALNKLTTIDNWGNSKGFGYGPDRRLGAQMMKVSRMTQTGTVAASDWITLPRIFEGIDK